MTAATEQRCIACGIPLPTKDHSRRHDGTAYYTSYCAACLQRVREGSQPLVCFACHVPKPAQGNFRRVGASKTGYAYTCNDCSRVAQEKQRQEFEEWRKQKEEQRKQREEGSAVERARRAAVRLVCRECGVEQAAVGNFHPSAQARTGYVGVCNTCVAARGAAARASITTLTCPVCQQTLDATEHFEPHDRMKTGYQQVCNLCQALSSEEYEERLEAQREARKTGAGVTWEELIERDRGYQVRFLVGGHRWRGPSFPPDQRIYALVDPRTEAIHYIGHSSKPERRLQDHLNRGRESNPDKEAWVTELRDLGMQPQLVILEQVEVADTVREREDRWIFHHLRRGEPLTNWQAYFRHLVEAVRQSSLDYLTIPLDDEGWTLLVEARDLDLAERR